MEIELECPLCGTTFTTDRGFVTKNKRIMCVGCCKSFDVELPIQQQDWYKKHILGVSDVEKEEGFTDYPEPMDSVVSDEYWSL